MVFLFLMLGVYILINCLFFFLQSRSLFVKNLNFKTSDESLKKYFSEHVKEGRILSVRVILLIQYLIFYWTLEHILLNFSVITFVYDMQVKKHVKNGKNVSMGFGFVEFDSVDTATNVCKDLQVRNYSAYS